MAIGDGKRGWVKGHVFLLSWNEPKRHFRGKEGRREGGR